ncbi:MAG: copper amine oxidase N-terminal domain-containing protein [Tissierellia bacterium]|nr:copper amine oxidase N-terminal domain-containing protein [Tissierellia bacterium]
MKKSWKRFTMILTLLLLFTAIPINSFAVEKATVSLWMNGDYVTPDVEPFIEHSRTYVPVRFISEAFGYDVQWIQKTKQVIISEGNTIIYLAIGHPRATVNGKSTPLDAPPTLYKDRTFVPLRFIAETFGKEVHWDPGARTVAIGPGYTPDANLGDDISGNYYAYINEDTHLGFFETYVTVYVEKLDYDYYKIIRNQEEVNGKGGYTAVAYGTYYPQGGYFEFSDWETTNNYGIFTDYEYIAVDGGHSTADDTLTLGEETYHLLAN